MFLLGDLSEKWTKWDFALLSACQHLERYRCSQCGAYKWLCDETVAVNVKYPTKKIMCKRAKVLNDAMGKLRDDKYKSSKDNGITYMIEDKGSDAQNKPVPLPTYADWLIQTIKKEIK